MKNRSPLARLALCSLALLASTASARTFSAIRAEGVLRVLAPADLPPFTFVTSGVNAGFEIELLGAIASDMGLKLDVQHAPSSQLFPALQDDRADVAVAALAITSTREQKVDFTQPTLCGGVSVISADPKIQLHTDLENKTIGVASGTIMESYVAKLPFQKTVKVFPTISDVTLALFSRQIDATFGYLIMKPTLDRLYPKYPTVWGPVLFNVPIGMATADSNTSTRSALNIGLIKVMRDGRYAKLSQKYFGTDVSCKRS
ncbi:substrate-binding periplasmic protein [Deinococcus aquiradiocola]|uniref:Amino acid ABC transporter substrate-binding protein n=1 Tax=Deinococcus aquiradiocola TaxID=393059 RepID=A0A917PEZ8_9DEIO|nr:ABC transporter substrate-binding protein [Deinococcus aquiradiocola]GGJ73940.1 amino acid ABC transporter substrate-binding protein [Deinococcus aquiradiocola]